MGVAQPTTFAGVAEQGLHHRQRDQFGIAVFGGDPHPGPNRYPLGVGFEQVVRSAIECGREGIEVGVRGGRSPISALGFNTDLRRPRPPTSVATPVTPLGITHLAQMPIGPEGAVDDWTATAATGRQRDRPTLPRPTPPSCATGKGQTQDLVFASIRSPYDQHD